MADTLSCQWETLHSQQLRSIKKSIDSDHGIYRDCHGRCAPELMKRTKVGRGRHGGRRRLGVSEPVNEFDRKPFEHRWCVTAKRLSGHG